MVLLPSKEMMPKDKGASAASAARVADGQSAPRHHHPPTTTSATRRSALMPDACPRSPLLLVTLPVLSVNASHAALPYLSMVMPAPTCQIADDDFSAVPGHPR